MVPKIPHHLPASHAQVQGRRDFDYRAVSARAFPLVRDLVVDRSALTKLRRQVVTLPFAPGAPDNAPVPKAQSDQAMDAAACIGCGACVASCKNASAMLFTAAKAGHLNMLPQGQAEKDKRALDMVSAMDEAGFGNCRNYGECSAACPKDISLDFIAKLNRDHAKANEEAELIDSPLIEYMVAVLFWKISSSGNNENKLQGRKVSHKPVTIRF